MAAQIFNDIGELAADIAGRFRATGIIGIDGWTGVGKTTLGKALASATGGSAFDLDDALVGDQKHFVQALRLDLIRAALTPPSSLTFVSGICLRQVMALVEFDADAYIYVKRMAMWGWADEDDLVGSGLPEIRGASGEVTRRELRPYHERWQPHSRADYEFQRFDLSLARRT